MNDMSFEWIPVDVRRPEPGSIVCDANGNIKKILGVNEIVDKKHGRWYISDEYGKCWIDGELADLFIYENRIVAWLQLEPYRVETILRCCVGRRTRAPRLKVLDDCTEIYCPTCGVCVHARTEAAARYFWNKQITEGKR